MRIQLRLFGILRDRLSAEYGAGSGAGWIEVTAGATVGDLLAALREENLADVAAVRLLSSIAVSVNAEYAQADRVLCEGDEVGLLPPVSGGLDDEPCAPVVSFLTRETIAAEVLIARAKAGSDGAVVVFDGIVRNNTRGRQTLYLDYDGYEEMAARQMTELAARAIAEFGVRHVTLVHRLGRLEIGETSVLIVVSSAHRGAAFEACRWVIDTLKKTVPIWKKETFVDGAVWADGEPFPPELAAGLAVGHAAEKNEAST